MESKVTFSRITQIRGFSSLSSSGATPELVGGYVEKGLLPTQEAEELSSWKFNTKRELSGDYIAGLCQADGSFSAVLCRKTRGDKEYFNLSLVFTLVQSQKYKNLLLEIQKKWGNIGHWYLSKTDNTIRYQITKQSDLLNVVIPFFIKHQLRGGKLKSFLKFKYIVEQMSIKAHVNNRQVLLSLVVIASHINPLGKLGNKIRYLKPKEQNYVINNVQPEGVDISELTTSLKNFKINNLTADFIQGLFDGDGGLSVFIKSLSQEGKKFKLSMGYSFTIVQDSDNLLLLEEIKSYFSNVGGIYEISKLCNIYKAGSKSDLITIILPKLANKESIELVKDPYEGLPFIKYNKIYCCCKILLLLSGSSQLTKESLNEILMLSYYISKNSDNLTLKQYIEDTKQKWLL